MCLTDLLRATNPRNQLHHWGKTLPSSFFPVCWADLCSACQKPAQTTASEQAAFLEAVMSGIGKGRRLEGGNGMLHCLTLIRCSAGAAMRSGRLKGELAR